MQELHDVVVVQDCLSRERMCCNGLCARNIDESIINSDLDEYDYVSPVLIYRRLLLILVIFFDLF